MESDARERPAPTNDDGDQAGPSAQGKNENVLEIRLYSKLTVLTL